MRSLTQLPSVFREANDTDSHTPGTWLLRNDVYMESRSADITMKPLIARLMSAKVLRMRFSSRLNLTISCTRQIARLFSSPLSWIMKVVSPASSSNNRSGQDASKDVARSVTISSEDFPAPPPLERGCRDSSVAIMPSDSFVLNVTLALSCMPNTSGSSPLGRDSK